MRIRVNGRFSLARETGVQRFARLVSAHAGLEDIRVPPSAWRSTLKANLWEQVALLGDEALLWSPANMGPLFRSNQVVTLHDAAVFAEPRWFSAGFALWYGLAWHVLSRGGCCLSTVSTESRKELAAHLGIRPGSIGVIPNGGEHLCTITETCPERLRDTSPERGRYFLFVGSLQPRKNLRVLLRAWSLCALPDGAQLLVVGADDKIFARMGHEERPANDVRFLGRVSDAELAWLYRRACALVAPSVYEGFDVPPLEALNLGCPVVLSDIPVHREIYDGAADFFPPHDERALADCLARAWLRGRPGELTDEELKPVRTYTWERAAGAVLRLLQSWSCHREGVVV